jgi:hypothetical protein
MRGFAFIHIAVCVVLGLGIRADLLPLPALLTDYAPDVLWAMMVFALAVLIAPRQPLPVVALAALGFALVMECSQLYQAQWMNEIRATRVGGLLLGHGFLWSDVMCYIFGIILAMSATYATCKCLKRMSIPTMTQNWK